MKIEWKAEKTVEFWTLNFGDVLEYDGEIYMKISCSRQSLVARLADGATFAFPDERRVTKMNGKFVVEEGDNED